MSENIVLQSVGSLSVAVLALLMLIVQALFFFRKPQFTWYAWSAAISFSALLYSIGIFLEYNTPQGPLNRFSGLLEWTAIICLIQCLYGFTFSYLGIESKRYHPIAGVCHGFILIFLWSTNYIVADSFITRNFISLKSPYIEPALGPLGPVFMLYAVAASVNAIIVWIKHKEIVPKHRITYLAGMGIWILLGIHDGLASLGVPTLQYFMEYGFLGFSMAVLWVAFNSYLEIAAEEKYHVIKQYFENLPLLAYNITFDGKINDINEVGVERLGYDSKGELIGKPLISTVYAPSSQRKAKRLLEKWKKEKILKNEELQIITKQGKIIDVLLNVDTVYDSNGKPLYSLSTQLDITERKHAEENLRQSEEQFRTIVETAPSLLIITDAEGNNIYVSPNCEQMTGYKVEELLGKVVWWVHDDDLARAKEIMNRVFSDRVRGRNFEYKAMKKNGDQWWASSSWELLHDVRGNFCGVVMQTLDITERKKAEEALRESQNQLRSLADHLQSVRENERTAMAREIHDELGQALTSLRMDLSWLAKKIPEDQTQLLDKLHSMSELTGSTLRTVQRISTELRPGLLDDLGLVAAIEWQTEEFQNRTGIRCTLTVDPDITLDDRRSTALFRILQETLINVARHAQATGVTVSLQEKDGVLKLRVRDNGKGITKDQISNPKSFGLLGIQERVNPWGGEVKISGRPGKGTTVMVRMPIKD